MRFISLLVFLAVIAGCNDGPFTGYLVAKEYTPEHMSTEPSETVSFAIVVPRPVVTPPRKVHEKWVWYVANKDGVRSYEVTPCRFHTKKCGDKITMP